MIVVVTPTIMDGPVVRWYSSETAEATGTDLMSASRNGVMVHTFLHKIPEDQLELAKEVYTKLHMNRYLGSSAVSHLATHERKGMFGPLEEIVKAES